jgi:hypothetical protein
MLVGRIHAVTLQIAAYLRRFDDVLAQCIAACRRSTPHVAWDSPLFEAEMDADGHGGLVVYGEKRHCEQRVMIMHLTSDDAHVAYSSVSEHVTGRVGSFYAAYFPALSPGRYVVYEPGSALRTRQFVTVSAGSCAEVRFE